MTSGSANGHYLQRMEAAESKARTPKWAGKSYHPCILDDLTNLTSNRVYNQNHTSGYSQGFGSGTLHSNLNKSKLESNT